MEIQLPLLAGVRNAAEVFLMPVTNCILPNNTTRIYNTIRIIR